MNAPRPRDNCMLFIENELSNRNIAHYANFDPVVKALLIGLEAGIKLERGYFDINSLSPPRTEKDE